MIAFFEVTVIGREAIASSSTFESLLLSISLVQLCLKLPLKSRFKLTSVSFTLLLDRQYIWGLKEG